MNSLTDKEINRASDGIDKALSTATRSNRGEVAFRILSVVRNLNDHIAFKIWKDVRPDQKMDINKVASKFGNVRPYQFIARFDHFLRASVSHFTPSEEGAERLMIKYYRYLLQLKKAVYDRYGMIIQIAMRRSSVSAQESTSMRSMTFSKVSLNCCQSSVNSI